MTEIVLHINEIVSDPNIRRGHPVIRGTGVRVWDVVAWIIHGELPPESFARNFRLSMGQVYAALAYYYLHRDQVEADMEADAEEGDAWLDDQDLPGRGYHIQ